MAALDTFRNALANAASSPCDILVVGDSTSEGYGATSIGARWENVLLSKLRSRAGVTGGEGYVPAWYADPTKTDRFTGGTFTTSGSLFGLGLRCIVLSAGTVSFTFTGTGVDVMFAVGTGGGRFTWNLDGGTESAQNSTYAANILGGWCFISVHNLERGEHTINITKAVGDTYIEGAMVYDGDEDHGVRLVTGAHFGYQAAQYASNTAWANSVTPAGYPYAFPTAGAPARVDPALAVILLGLNDYRSNGHPRRTADQFKADTATIVTKIRTNTATDPSILLVIPWEPAASGALPSSWSDYRAAYQSLADADDGIELLDLGQSIGSFVAGDPNGYALADGLHLNDTGYARVADAVGGSLVPQPAPVTPAPILMPDVQVWAYNYLTDALAARSESYADADVTVKLPDTLPDRLVWVRRDGGTRADVVRDIPRLAVNILTRNEADCADLARLVRALLWAAPDGDPVCRVTELSGPSAIDDPSGRPRAYMLFEVVTRGTQEA